MGDLNSGGQPTAEITVLAKRVTKALMTKQASYAEGTKLACAVHAVGARFHPVASMPKALLSPAGDV